MPVLEWPDYPQVKGVFVGGCVDRGEGSSFRARAHAHCVKGNIKPGWICVRGWKRLEGTYAPASGAYAGTIVKPNRILMHELAHILSGHGHDDTWRRMMKELGQPLTKQYQKKRLCKHAGKHRIGADWHCPSCNWMWHIAVQAPRIYH